jgi:Raf kinase inhibitor-like YbhB/YbcL family protein
MTQERKRDMRKPGLLLLAAATFALSCGSNPDAPQPPLFELTSTAFVDSGPIPIDYSLQGENVSPPLAWTGAPTGTAGYALICNDITAPGGWIHWVIYEMPADLESLYEGVGQVPNPFGSVLQGLNEAGEIGYIGPNPPPGEIHSYSFELSALDTILALDDSLTALELQQAIDGHVLGTAILTGTYETICE